MVLTCHSDFVKVQVYSRSSSDHVHPWLVPSSPSCQWQPVSIQSPSTLLLCLLFQTPHMLPAEEDLASSDTLHRGWKKVGQDVSLNLVSLHSHKWIKRFCNSWCFRGQQVIDACLRTKCCLWCLGTQLALLPKHGSAFLHYSSSRHTLLSSDWTCQLLSTSLCQVPHQKYGWRKWMYAKPHLGSWATLLSSVSIWKVKACFCYCHGNLPHETWLFHAFYTCDMTANFDATLHRYTK